MDQKQFKQLNDKLDEILSMLKEKDGQFKTASQPELPHTGDDKDDDKEESD